MKKKTVNHSTMFNVKGFLILIAFGIWVNLMMGEEKSFKSAEEALLSYGGNTLAVISVTYVLFVILGLFIETKSTDRFF